MRRKEKEITDQAEIVALMEKAEICRLAMTDGETPYMVPMNFGFRDMVLYFHSAGQGRKIDILRKNPRVCFEIESDTALIESEEACDWSMKYRTVIGSGRAEFIEDPSEKTEAFDIIMNQYSPGRKFNYPKAMIKAVTLFKVSVDEISGKKSGFNKGNA